MRKKAITMDKIREMKVTPWEVSGHIDYEKLIKEFGLKPINIDILPKEFSESVLFRRNTGTLKESQKHFAKRSLFQ